MAQAVVPDRTVDAPPLRVLWVSPKPEFEAAMIFVERQIEALLAAGVEGRTFHLQIRPSAPAMFGELRRLRRAIREFQPHLVHAQYGTVTAFISALASLRPLIVTYRGSDLNPHPQKGWLRCNASRFMSQVAALRAQGIICVSRQLVERLWCGKNKTVVIPSGIDTRLFSPRPRDEARAQLGWDAGELVVFFNGAHRILKRPDLARAAVEVARRRCGPIRLVELDGSQSPDTVPWIMNAADCLILTSDHEGSPNVVKEAIACGLPVVARDVGDVRERLAKVYPSKVTSESVEELGEAVAEILLSGARSNGPEVAAEFASDAISRRIIQLYEQTAKKSRNLGV